MTKFVLARRRLLGVFAVVLAWLAGCQDESGTVTPDPEDPIRFVITNEQETGATVQVTVTRDDGATVLDESVTLDAGTVREFNPGIEQPGKYELTAAIESGLQRTITLDIGADDIRSGTAYRVILRDNGVQVTWGK